MTESRVRRVSGAGGCPTTRAGSVSPAGVQTGQKVRRATPDNHFTASPDCRVTLAGKGRASGARGCPTIRAGIVFPADVREAARVKTTPDDHFISGPDCRMKLAGRGRVSGAGGCPAICNRIVSPAGVKTHTRLGISSTPDDHFTAGPKRREQSSALRRVYRARCCPTIRAGIVSPAGV